MRNISEAVEKRILHIKGHLKGAFNNDSLVRNILSKKGDQDLYVVFLGSHAEGTAMYAWFSSRDLASMRQWCYVAAKINQKYYLMKEDRFGPGGKFLTLLFPLLSNHRPMIEWFAHYDDAFDLKRVEDHRTHDFLGYQGMVALRGEWDRLAERCRRVLANPPGASRERKYLLDHYFYAALAAGDRPGMVKALEALLTPRAVKGRANDDGGFAEDLYTKAAVIHAKIAWYHGYEITVDSPYLPAEWLPMTPLDHYDNHYSFLT